MIRFSLTIALLLSTGSALADPPNAWKAFSLESNPGGRGCSRCHGSADIQTWSTRPHLQGLSSDNFVSRLDQGPADEMKDLAADETEKGKADRAAILQYLLDVRDGRVTESMVLGAVTIDADSGTLGSVTIANERSRSITYTMPTFSVSNGFSVSTESCPTREVPPGSFCTLTVRFLPQSPPFTGATRGAAMNLTLSGTGGDPHPGSRSVALSGDARAALEITPPFLTAFTATKLNTSEPRTVTIANRLNSALRLCLADEPNSPSLSAPEDFNLVGQTYDAGTRCTTLQTLGTLVNQTITFTPSKDGPRLARFTAQRMNGDMAVKPLESIALQGNPGPFMSISGAGLANNTLFTGVRQDVSAGSAAPSIVALKNAGNTTMRISGISISRVADAGSAEYTASGCAVGILWPGAVCNLSVSFDPLDIGTRESQLSIGYSDTANPPESQRTVSINLRGLGTRGASLVVRNAGGTEVTTGSLVGFGNQNLNVPISRRITLHNIGSEESLVLSVPTSSSASGSLDLVAPSIANACTGISAGITLAPLTSCVAELRFLPTAVSNYATTISLPSRPAGAATPTNPFVFNLTGAGVDGRPALQWQTAAGTALALLELPGISAVGSPAAPQVSLRLANPGPGAAALHLLNIIGTDASSFTLGANAPGRCDFGSTAIALLEGNSCEVVIVFRPHTAGAKLGGLQLISTGTTPAPLEIRAQASGPAATIALMATPLSINLNEVRVGAQSAPAAIRLSNEGSLVAVVTAIESSAGFVAETGTCGALPFTIEPRGSCALAVRFAPGGTGTASGSMRVQVSGVAAPLQVALAGQGTDQADVSTGGCSLADGRAPTDPTLWALVLLAVFALCTRRRQQGRRDRQSGGPLP
jgi:hypothetical protein